MRGSRRVLSGAVLAGGFTGLAVAPGGVGSLAWVALVPLLAALGGAAPRLTLTASIAYATVGGLTGVSPWLTQATAAYFGLSAWRATAYILPSVAIFSAAHGALLGVLLLGRPSDPRPWTALWYGAVWACWEAVRMWVFPYYPAAILGLSQWQELPSLQVASVCGIAGVTFVIVTVNASLAALIAHSTASRGTRARVALTGLVLAAAAFGWGSLRLASVNADARSAAEIVTIDIGALAPAPDAVERYLAASAEPAASKPALIIWPESALTTDVEHDRGTWARLSGFVTSSGTSLLTGGPGARRTSGKELARFNSVHLLQPGRGLQSYHKRYLVPFAERWPSILGDPPPELASVEAGHESPVLQAGAVSFGVLICFEIADSPGARALANSGASFIVNPTNDTWFRGASAPHLPWAAARAVETGLPVVRAANAGVSVVFDRFGRQVASGQSSAFASILATTLPAASPTLFCRTGDWFLVICLALVLAPMLGTRR